MPKPKHFRRFRAEGENSSSRAGYSVVAHFDGGCWPNPGGAASWAFVAKNSFGCVQFADSGKIDAGGTSNNVVECVAAAMAIRYIMRACKPGSRALLCGDSRVALSKIGTSKPCKGLFEEAMHVAQFFYRQAAEKGIKIDLKWVPRHQNAESDALT